MLSRKALAIPQVGLDSIITAAELQRRPVRTPQHDAENRTLLTLAHQMASSPDDILQRLAEAALELCHAHSAGISLMQGDEKRVWAPHRGEGKAIVEALQVPLYLHEKPVGTIWVAAQDKGRRFDAEDQRLLESLGTVASAACHVLASLDALRASEARHRAVVTATSSVIFTADAEGAFAESQESWEGYTGQPWSEHRGFGWAAMLHPDDREQVLTEWRASCSQARVYESRGRIWHAATGAFRHFAVRAAPVRDAEGGVHEWVGTLADIEDRWQAQQGLQQMDRLETVGQLAGGIAHEANNQMTVVLGYSDYLLRRNDLPPDARPGVEQVRKAAERTAVIAAQLLAFSRRQLLQPTAVDLNELIKGMELILQRTLGEAGILVLDLAPEAVITKVDSGRFEQVLLNFVLNARDAMDQGGRLTIGTRAVNLTEAPSLAYRPRIRMEPGRYAELTVQDSGHGMDEETMGRVFEPFFTTKKFGLGNGLGLSTVYGIVKQSGGYIWVASRPGQGTTFTIHLPLISAAELAAPAQGEAPATAARPGQTVLIVEDEPGVREIAARVLTDRGYRVIVAEDGQAALDLLVEPDCQVDAVVTDLAMPGVSGRELAGRIERLRPGVPLLFMSGYTDDDVVRRGLLDAGQPFFRKPFSPEELARRVRDLLRDRLAS